MHLIAALCMAVLGAVLLCQLSGTLGNPGGRKGRSTRSGANRPIVLSLLALLAGACNGDTAEPR